MVSYCFTMGDMRGHDIMNHENSRDIEKTSGFKRLIVPSPNRNIEVNHLHFLRELCIFVYYNWIKNNDKSYFRIPSPDDIKYPQTI